MPDKKTKRLTEVYGKSPLIEQLNDIKRIGNTDESVKVSAYARFIEDRIRHGQ